MGKPDPLKIKPAIGKKPRKEAKPKRITRGMAYTLIKQVGAGFGTDATQSVTLPDYITPEALKALFLDKAVDEATGKLVKQDAFDSRYRGAMKKQDELFSTASTRNFVDGLLGASTRSQIADDVWARWTEMVDLISALRIPTKYSGFSTSAGVMQHPTGLGEGYFSALKVDGPHGRYDSERVKYIGRALEISIAAGESLGARFFAAVRAALEFSLNYFTAPVTASNVKPFSTKSAVAQDDPSMQDQLESRERIKEIYVKFGGNLRNLSSGVTETPEESWDRPWQQNIAITKEEPFPIAPPSPRRSRKAKSDASSVATTTPVAADGAPLASPFPAPVSVPALVIPQLVAQGSGSLVSPGTSSIFASPPPSLADPAPGNPFAVPPLSGTSVALSSSLPTLADDVVQGIAKALSSFLVSAPDQSLPIDEIVSQWMAIPEGVPLNDPLEDLFSGELRDFARGPEEEEEEDISEYLGDGDSVGQRGSVSIEEHVESPVTDDEPMDVVSSDTEVPAMVDGPLPNLSWAEYSQVMNFSDQEFDEMLQSEAPVEQPFNIDNVDWPAVPQGELEDTGMDVDMGMDVGEGMTAVGGSTVSGGAADLLLLA